MTAYRRFRWCPYNAAVEALSPWVRHLMDPHLKSMRLFILGSQRSMTHCSVCRIPGTPQTTKMSWLVIDIELGELSTSLFRRYTIHFILQVTYLMLGQRCLRWRSFPSRIHGWAAHCQPYGAMACRIWRLCIWARPAFLALYLPAGGSCPIWPGWISEAQTLGLDCQNPGIPFVRGHKGQLSYHSSPISHGRWVSHFRSIGRM